MIENILRIFLVNKKNETSNFLIKLLFDSIISVSIISKINKAFAT